MSYLPVRAIPVSMTDDLEEKIKSVRQRNHLPGHTDILVTFKKGCKLSMIKGPASFNSFELMLMNKYGTTIKTKDGDDIYRTQSNSEVVAIIRRAANL